jgi:hypothetical protein
VVGIGGMTNRLMLRVRTELGLAYTVGAFFRPDWTHTGYFYGWCGTRNDQAAAALEELLQVLAESRNNPVPGKEFEAVRTRVLNAEVFRVDSPSKVLDRAIDLAFYGYAPDYWQKVEERMRTATAGEAGGAVRKRLTAAKMVAVAVGPADQIEKQLRRVAEVRRISTRPGVVASSAEALAEIERLLSATGGRERWAKLRSVEFETVFQTEGFTIPTHQWYVLDEPWVRIDHRLQGRKNLVVLTPEEIWQNDAVSVERLGYHEHSSLLLAHQRWLPRVLHELAREGSTLGAELGAGGRLAISDDRGPLCWIELGEDGRPLRLGWDGIDAETFEYVAWAETEGYAYPSTFLRKSLASTVEVTSFTPNVPIDPELFDFAAEKR